VAVVVVVWGVEAAVVFIDVVETLVAEVVTVTDDFVVDFAEVNSTDEAADVGVPVAPVDVESVSTNQYNTLRYYALNLCFVNLSTYLHFILVQNTYKMPN